MSWHSRTFPTVEAAPEFPDIVGRISFDISNDDEVEPHPHHEQVGEQIAPFEPTPNHNNEMANPDVQNLSCTKRRKLNSKVWKEFTKYKEDGKEWAICKHCERKFPGSSKKGTTHLKNHLERCPSKRNPGAGADKTIDTTTAVVIKGKSVIDQELIHLDLVRKIIKYGFSSLNPIRAEVLHIYKEEKEKLRRFLVKLLCRFSLKFESFEFDSSLIVLHFIDDSWKLRKKIIDFQYENRNMISLATFKDSVLDLKIDKDIYSMVTSISEEDWELSKINSWLTKRALLPFGGQILPICWLTENLCVVNGPKWTVDLLEKIKKSFNYVKDTKNEDKFQSAFYKAKSMGKKMTSSEGLNPKKWNTFDEFKILERAVGLKEAFCELEEIDPGFKSINLTEEEWYKATVALKCAEVLKDVADGLSKSRYTTSNVYFSKVCDLFLKLLQWEKSDNCYAREIASCIRDKYFDKYWSNANLVLLIAIVLDPRFKLDIVVCWYNEIYCNDDANGHLKKIIDDVTDVYNEYAKGPRMLDAMGRPCASSQNRSQLELDVYLKESKIPSVEEFDILAWWYDKAPNFPILARMARDFLAVPISNTDISDSSSLKIEFQNVYYCEGLDADIRRALVCTKSWMESP